VETCVLQPNGTFFVKGKQPAKDDVDRAELMAAIQSLHAEVLALRGEINGAA
jgi:hypothetical protein